MQIDQLAVEITRKCNMRCPHCLRGDAQNINIDPFLFEKFISLNEITYIGSLLITGGEPFLNYPVMTKISKYLKRNKIRLGGFYLATNGTVFANDAVKPLIIFKELVDEEEMFTISISKDEFHENKIHPIWSLINTSFRETKREHVIAEGNGKDINPDGRTIKDDEWVWDEGDLMEGMVYINAKGMVCKSCDYSYDSQEKHNIGHCLSKRLIDM